MRRDFVWNTHLPNGDKEQDGKTGSHQRAAANDYPGEFHVKFGEIATFNLRIEIHIAWMVCLNLPVIEYSVRAITDEADIQA